MLYHYSAQIISRKDGKSAVAAAAYRAGEILNDERYGRRHDYSRKLGIAHSEILLPTGAAKGMGNRQELWNWVEAIEKHPRAQLCREVVVALQTELSVEENLELLKGFLHERFVSRGLVVDLAVHYPMGEDGGAKEVCKNPHAHMMCVLRPVEEGRFGNKLQGKRTDHQAELLEERAAWADHVNAALAKAGVEGRVSHQSLVEQGISRLPQIHLGVHAHAMEQRGIRTERGELLAAILEHNQQMDAVTQTQQLAEAEENRSPTGGGSARHGEGMEPMEPRFVNALDPVAEDLDLTQLTGDSETSDAVLAFENAALPTEGWDESEVIAAAVIDADLAESVRADEGAVSASDALAEDLPKEMIMPVTLVPAGTQVQPVQPVKASESATTHRKSNVVGKAAQPPEQSAEVDLVEQVEPAQTDLIKPKTADQDSPPQWIGATSDGELPPAQVLSKTAPTQQQIEQAEQITYLLKTALAMARQFPGQYDFSALKQRYTVKFDGAGRLTLSRSENGQALIDQGRPTAGLEQRDWEFFRAWKAELMRQEQRRRASVQPTRKKPQQRRMDGR